MVGYHGSRIRLAHGSTGDVHAFTGRTASAIGNVDRFVGIERDARGTGTAPRATVVIAELSIPRTMRAMTQQFRRTLTAALTTLALAGVVVLGSSAEATSAKASAPKPYIPLTTSSLLVSLQKNITSSSTGELKRCAIPLRTNLVASNPRGWYIEPQPGSTTDFVFISPRRVAFCDITIQKHPYTLIAAEFSSAKELDKAVSGLKTRDGMLFLGIPSSFSLLNPKHFVGLRAGSSAAGTISTDDCGGFGTEVFDNNCPQGLAAAKRMGSVLLVLSDRYRTGTKPLTRAPVDALNSLLS